MRHEASGDGSIAAMRSFSATVLLSLLLIHGVAAAQARPADAAATNDAAARGRFAAGEAFYEEGRFEEALDEFAAAWRLSQRPEMLINIANAAERSLKFDVAVEHLRLYLERVPDAADRPTIERRIARDESTLARANPPRTDVVPPPVEATPPPVDTTPGEPRIPPVDEDSGGGAPVAAIVTLSVGGALAIGALITGLVAHGTYADLDGACPGGICPPDRAGDIDSGTTMALVSTVLTGLAVVAGGIGLVLLVMGDSDDEAPATSARLELAPGPAPLGATARVRF